MIGSILGAVWEGMKGAVAWIIGYSKPDVKEARRINDEKDKIDALRNDLNEKNLDEIRRKLS